MNMVRKTKDRVKSKAFTVIELLVVIVIIGVLSGIVFVVYTGVQKKAVYAATKAEAVQVARQLGLYQSENGGYPSDEEFPEDFEFDDEGYDYEYFESCDWEECEEGEIADWYSFSIWPDGGEQEDDGVIITSDDTTPDPIAAPDSCPEGFIPVPGNNAYGQAGFCVMKYEARRAVIDGELKAVSRAEGDSLWTNVAMDYSADGVLESAISYAESACDGCHLIKESEWLTIATNIAKVGSNWVSGTVGSGDMYNGNTENTVINSAINEGSGDQRRTYTLSNGQVIWDFSGNVSEWTSGKALQLDFESSGVLHPIGDYTSIGWGFVGLSDNNSLVANPMPSYGVDGAENWGYTVGSLSFVGEQGSQANILRSRGNGTYVGGGIYNMTLAAPSSTVGGFRSAK